MLNISEIIKMFNSKFQLTQKILSDIILVFFSTLSTPHKYFLLMRLSLREVSKYQVRAYP